MAAAVNQLASSFSSLSLGKLRVSSSHQSPSNSPSFKQGPLVIRCARVAGIEIPNNKRIETSLTYIHGIGKTTARQVLFDLGMENKMTKELVEEELTILRREVNKYTIEGDLRRFVAANIKYLRDIRCYRGRRHAAGLPCRGQSTRTNARTRKGKKNTVAGKKK